MRLPRLLPAALGAVLGVVGAVVAVVVARLAALDQAPVDQLAIAVAVSAWAAVAMLVTVARPGNRVGDLLALGVAAWGVGEGSLSLGLRGNLGDSANTAAAWLTTLGTASRALGWLVLVLAVPFVFPDGKTPWPGRRGPGGVVVGAIALFTVATLLAPVPLDRRAAGIDSPTGLPEGMQLVADALALAGLAACVVALVVAITGLVHRWRIGDTLRHQQLLWLGLAFALPVLFMPLIATEIAQPWMFALVTLPAPVAVGVAILQRRLYDVQWAVSSTLTYATLSAAVAGLYALTVAGVGAVLDQRGARWLPWLGAGVVAVAFAPLRNTLQQAVTKLTYGQWAQPAQVLGATARRLADATNVPALLDSLTAELGDSLRLSRVEIRDDNGRLLAASGTHREALEEHPLTAYGAPVGTLRWASDRTLREGDRRLLEDVASQLGAVLHTAVLVDTLRDAQHRLVLAREEERRRLRRDLHDGLGPALASLTLKVDELRNRWPTLADPDNELVRLRSAIQAAVSDVRRIVEGLRPAPLDELGLAGALEQLTLRGSPDLEVDIDVRPLPPLPAAVEVAVFRIVEEALLNARRHARAGHVAVALAAHGDCVQAEVRDDGVGTVSARPGGVGLSSMRERAEELGGRLTICGQPGTGTIVRLQLPLVAGAPAEVTAS